MAEAARPIPEGLHAVTPHLAVNGAAEAIEFYKRAFGAREVARSAGPDGKSVIHAEIRLATRPSSSPMFSPGWVRNRRRPLETPA